ncbi:hypothetical protein C8J27_1206 [Rhodobacter aestuarii]|uniref:Uncharacterized protein n=1 Tax=Rhodobacter aestuarii TaxID=453582 RepID=A0A1N7QI35_9RHOB|nr:hypothetical protein [Rhodobacter aestuarii]PTV93283.1 hypothetical protein C8J27_1206 [Rhodobacter aestuarii]SIT22535.1 hypothetical protein SAMN05421580_1226 [Rhodobacter aestuarii]
MTTQKYTRKIAATPMPAQLERAAIVLRYGADFAATGRAAGLAEKVGDAMRHIETLAAHGFLGLRGLACHAEPLPERAGVALHLQSPSSLPPDLLVISTRIAVGLHNADPAGYARLLDALDGDAAQARALWSGVDFETAVAGVELHGAGNGPAQPFDPFWLGGAAGEVWQGERLEIPGCAKAMPGSDLEDALLLASAFGAFWPLGQDAEHELGDEEYFTDGDDLILADASFEAASLRAILTCLGVSPVPEPLGLER